MKQQEQKIAKIKERLKWEIYKKKKEPSTISTLEQKLENKNEVKQKKKKSPTINLKGFRKFFERTLEKKLENKNEVKQKKKKSSTDSTLEQKLENKNEVKQKNKLSI
jgi:hypothetical protein